MEKVIFVDVHGVLETTRCATHEDFDPRAIKELKEIIEKTGAKVGLTSNGRGVARDKLKAVGIPVYSVTPFIPYSNRNQEIGEWIANAPFVHGISVATYVILDDSDDGFPSEKLLKTEYTQGITPAIASQAIAILNQPTLTNGDHVHCAHP